MQVCFADKDNSVYCPYQSIKMVKWWGQDVEKKAVILIFVFVAGGACKSGADFTRSGRMGAAYRSINTKKTDMCELVHISQSEVIGRSLSEISCIWFGHQTKVFSF
jgi:hypothetical protein